MEIRKGDRVIYRDPFGTERQGIVLSSEDGFGLIQVRAFGGHRHELQATNYRAMPAYPGEWKRRPW